MADDRNVVEILVTSRNKTKAGFKEAEAEAEASAGRISGAFSKMSDNIGSKLKSMGANIGKNLASGGGIFAALSSGLSMAGPLAAAGAAVGAFGAVAIPILTKVTKAHQALLAAQQKYNAATTKSQRVTALKAEKAATDGLTSSEKSLMGPVSQLQAMWGRLENQMAPLVVMVTKVALSLAQDLMPAISTLAGAGGNALETILGYLGQFVRTPFFTGFINQLAQMASAMAPLIGQTLVQLIRLLAQLFEQTMPAGMQILTILLPTLVRLTSDLVPVITVLAKVTAVTLEWLQHTHLLLPVLGLVAAAIISIAGPGIALYAAIAVLIAVTVDLYRHWSTVWHGIKAIIMDAFDWIKGHWPLLAGILGGPVGVAVAYIVTHWQQLWSATVRVFGDIRGFIVNTFGSLRHDAAALIDDIVNFFAQLPGRVMGAIGNLGSDIWSHVTGGLGGLAHMIGLASGGIAGAASGGVHGGLRLVGEHGPELVRLPQGSTVRSHPDTVGALGGGTGGGDVVFQFNGSAGGLESLFWTWLKNGVRAQGGDPAMFQRKVAFR